MPDMINDSIDTERAGWSPLIADSESDTEEELDPSPEFARRLQAIQQHPDARAKKVDLQTIPGEKTSPEDATRDDHKQYPPGNEREMTTLNDSSSEETIISIDPDFDPFSEVILKGKQLHQDAQAVAEARARAGIFTFCARLRPTKNQLVWLGALAAGATLGGLGIRNLRQYQQQKYQQEVQRAAGTVKPPVAMPLFARGERNPNVGGVRRPEVIPYYDDHDKDFDDYFQLQKRRSGRYEVDYSAEEDFQAPMPELTRTDLDNYSRLLESGKLPQAYIDLMRDDITADFYNRYFHAIITRAGRNLDTLQVVKNARTLFLESILVIEDMLERMEQLDVLHGLALDPLYNQLTVLNRQIQRTLNEVAGSEKKDYQGNEKVRQLRRSIRTTFTIVELQRLQAASLELFSKLLAGETLTSPPEVILENMMLSLDPLFPQAATMLPDNFFDKLIQNSIEINLYELLKEAFEEIKREHPEYNRLYFNTNEFKLALTAPLDRSKDIKIYRQLTQLLIINRVILPKLQDIYYHSDTRLDKTEIAALQQTVDSVFAIKQIKNLLFPIPEVETASPIDAALPEVSSTAPASLPGNGTGAAQSLPDANPLAPGNFSDMSGGTYIIVSSAGLTGAATAGTLVWALKTPPDLYLEPLRVERLHRPGRVSRDNGAAFPDPEAAGSEMDDPLSSESSSWFDTDSRRTSSNTDTGRRGSRPRGSSSAEEAQDGHMPYFSEELDTNAEETFRKHQLQANEEEEDLPVFSSNEDVAGSSATGNRQASVARTESRQPSVSGEQTAMRQGKQRPSNNARSDNRRKNAPAERLSSIEEGVADTSHGAGRQAPAGGGRSQLPIGEADRTAMKARSSKARWPWSSHSATASHSGKVAEAAIGGIVEGVSATERLRASEARKTSIIQLHDFYMERFPPLMRPAHDNNFIVFSRKLKELAQEEFHGKEYLIVQGVKEEERASAPPYIQQTQQLTLNHIRYATFIAYRLAHNLREGEGNPAYQSYLRHYFSVALSTNEESVLREAISRFKEIAYRVNDFFMESKQKNYKNFFVMSTKQKPANKEGQYISLLTDKELQSVPYAVTSYSDSPAIGVIADTSYLVDPMHVQKSQRVKTYDLAETLIHEATHAVCGTMDYFYMPKTETGRSLNAKKSLKAIRDSLSDMGIQEDLERFLTDIFAMNNMMMTKRNVRKFLKESSLIRAYLLLNSADHLTTYIRDISAGSKPNAVPPV